MINDQPAHPRPFRVHLLHPGDMALAERGERLQTLLGSCIAIILTDPRRQWAAMCHVVHAGWPTPLPGASTLHAAPPATCWGEPALLAMAQALERQALVAAQCDAYVFGGGNMFADHCPPPHVGDRNIDWALKAMTQARIRVVAHSLGGTVYRRVAWTVGDAAPEVEEVEA